MFAIIEGIIPLGVPFHFLLAFHSFDERLALPSDFQDEVVKSGHFFSQVLVFLDSVRTTILGRP